MQIEGDALKIIKDNKMDGSFLPSTLAFLHAVLSLAHEAT